MVAVSEALTVTSISAVYSGGDVFVGTDVNALTSITVTATYSNGQTANVTGYTLSGTIVSGLNTITVSYSGCTTTFTVTGVEYSLLHQYTYGNGASDIGSGYIGWVDDIGDYDLSTATDSAWIKGDTSNTDAARASWGLYPGDDFTVKIKGYSRSSQYYSQSLEINLSGDRYQNGGSFGRRSTDRFCGIRQKASSGTGTKNAAVLRISYYGGEDGTTSLDSFSENTCAPINSTPVDIVVYYDSSTGILTSYVDGTLFNTVTFDLSRKSYIHIDGIAIRLANIYTTKYWAFSQIQVYKGIANS